MKTHIRNSDTPVEEIGAGIKRQILGYNTNLMLARVYFDRGAVAASHKHPHQQISYVEQGAFLVDIDGTKDILRQGDCFVIPENSRHGVVCLEEGILIDTFSPARQDFLGKTKGS